MLFQRDSHTMKTEEKKKSKNNFELAGEEFLQSLHRFRVFRDIIVVVEIFGGRFYLNFISVRTY